MKRWVLLTMLAAVMLASCRVSPTAQEEARLCVSPAKSVAVMEEMEELNGF